jgi:ATP-dependent RNA helicase DeaD
MLRALKRTGFEHPTPIQAALIPRALEGEDLIGQARTGTGKTAAFGIPILEQLDPLEECLEPQALILVPTRELADQVGSVLEKLAWGVPTSIAVLAGGKDLKRQLRQLKSGVQVVVGTPGRVHDHLQRGSLITRSLWCVVLDEADRMLDIGFRPQIERILRRCPTDRQTLLLSATLAGDVRKLAQRYMQTPELIDCSTKELSVDSIDQYYFSVVPDRKLDLLIKLLQREQPEQAIVFCRTKRGTDRLYRKLSEHFNDVGCMHGDMEQRKRDKVLDTLRSRKLKVLVATDVVGRGIDITTISHIVNFDIPQDCDDYVHRVGRTGRMGREGVAYTFIAPGEGEFLTSIEQRINKLLKRDSIDGISQPVTTPPAIEAPPVTNGEPPALPPKPKLNRFVGRARRRR